MLTLSNFVPLNVLRFVPLNLTTQICDTTVHSSHYSNFLTLAMPATVPHDCKPSAIVNAFSPLKKFLRAAVYPVQLENNWGYILCRQSLGYRYHCSLIDLHQFDAGVTIGIVYL